MVGGLKREDSNVVTESLLQHLLQKGYLAEVVCSVAMHKKNNAWYGEWFIRVINQDRTYEKLLVPARSRTTTGDEIVARTFKTVTGLLSFLKSVGLSSGHVPFEEGGREIHKITEKI